MVASKRRAKYRKSLENSANSDVSVSLINGGTGADSTTIVGRIKGNICACAAVLNVKATSAMASSAEITF